MKSVGGPHAARGLDSTALYYRSRAGYTLKKLKAKLTIYIYIIFQRRPYIV